MRETSIASSLLALDDPPADPAQLQRYLREQNIKVVAAFNALAAGHVDKQHKPPPKPRDGDIRYASGPGGWDPGMGSGFYYFNGSEWKLLG